MVYGRVLSCRYLRNSGKQIWFTFVVGLISVTGLSNAALGQNDFTNAGADANWSTAGNWSLGVPTSSNTTWLVFDYGDAGTSTNDLGALTLNRLDVTTPLTAFPQINFNQSGGSSLVFDGTNPSINVTGSYAEFILHFNQPFTLNQTLMLNAVDEDTVFRFGNIAERYRWHHTQPRQHAHARDRWQHHLHRPDDDQRGHRDARFLRRLG